jgi:hypothetical protein
MKPPAQVLSEYLAATTPMHWMFDEVAEYLFGDKSREEREELADELFERLDDERDRFAGSALADCDLVDFTLHVQKTAGRVLETSYATIPSPVVLLEMCLKVCEPTDEVHVLHRYASGDVCDFEARWPFGMDWAVRATTPMGETLYEDGDIATDDLDFIVPQSRWRVALAVLAGVVSGVVLGALIPRRSR